MYTPGVYIADWPKSFDELASLVGFRDLADISLISCTFLMDESIMSERCLSTTNSVLLALLEVIPTTLEMRVLFGRVWPPVLEVMMATGCL